MRAFLEPFIDFEDIEAVRKGIRQSNNIYDISGCIDADKAHLIYGIGHDFSKKLIVTFDELRAKELYEEYAFFDENTVYYPGKDLLFYQSDIRGNALTKERVQALRRIVSGEDITVITTIDALMNKLPKKESFETGVIHFSIEDTVNLTELRTKLVSLGYEAVSQVEASGEFAVRGGIIDIFSLTEENPVRIELWGDEIDSIRIFDAASQKSIEGLQEITIYPAMELVLDEDTINEGILKIEKEAKELSDQYYKEMKTEAAYRVKSNAEEICENLRAGAVRQEIETHLLYFLEETCSLISYFDKDTVVFLDELGHLEDKAKTVEMEFVDSMERRLSEGFILPKQLEILYSVEQVFGMIDHYPGVIMSTLEAKKNLLKIERHIYIHVQQGTSYNNSFPTLVQQLKKYKKNSFRVILVSPSRTRAKRLADDLMDEELNAFYTEDFDHLVYPGEIMVTAGSIKHGFDYPSQQFAVITESDIFGQRHHKKKARKKYDGEKIISFNDLNVGDYVVHENHGLGIYRGMEKIEVDHIMKDYIKIEYAKNGNLYILATQLDSIQKYSSKDGKKPKLNVLGNQEWTKTKAKVQSAVGEVAKELVELYALRQQDTGFVYGPDTVWQQEFEESFPYEETEGQLLAVEDVKKDMMSPKIMDRLICGDVGFGKTEIAMRAAFKAVQEGKQVVYLCPTTILAEQHYNNFAARMKDFPVNVELLCRFRTPTEQKATIKRMKTGECDILIGTHRVLSADVEYKDLGLLIIDEEQRFGVNHKEKIKQLKKNVDVLSLSATPIPRTLHMSLVGIRDMSVLDEAPMDRLPIQTFVFEYNDELIREAIVREMARGGQVYYVINQIKTIADVAAHIEKLVPEANVAYAHGQMNESQLEKIMYGFINREIDILVATTIIEIGLDISNVNTIIIHDSDKLGLSQLYQLRGRVGRSNRTAYAFLMYKKDKMLKEVAEKRLAAIREYTELGSGFKIAMRDLEIRGAGNLLGRAQHGHMEAVGYDLYCKMLNEAVRREKGEVVEESFDTLIDINIDAFIPGTYVEDEMQRLDIYKRIASIETEDERDDMTDELIDRFGDIPKPVQNLLLIALLKMKAHKAYVSEIRQRGGKVSISLFKNAKINPLKISELVNKFNPYVRFVPDKEAPYFLFDLKYDSRVNEKEAPKYIDMFVEDLYDIAVEK